MHVSAYHADPDFCADPAIFIVIKEKDVHAEPSLFPINLNIVKLWKMRF